MTNRNSSKFFSSIFLLYSGTTYKNLCKLWGLALLFWYFCFTTALTGLFSYDVIIIGPGYTDGLIDSLMFEQFFLKGLCFQTIYFLDNLSQTFGCHIYLPTIAIFYRRKPPTQAAPENAKADKPSPASKESSTDDLYRSSTFWGRFGARGNPKNSQPTPQDFNQCSEMNTEMPAPTFGERVFGGDTERTTDSEDGQRRVTTIRTMQGCVMGGQTHFKCKTGEFSPDDKNLVKNIKHDVKKETN